MRQVIRKVDGLDFPFEYCDELIIDIARGSYLRVPAVSDVKLLVLLQGEFFLEAEGMPAAEVGPGDCIFSAVSGAYSYRPRASKQRQTVLRALRVVWDRGRVRAGATGAEYESGDMDERMRLVLSRLPAFALIRGGQSGRCEGGRCEGDRGEGDRGGSAREGRVREGRGREGRGRSSSAVLVEAVRAEARARQDACPERISALLRCLFETLALDAVSPCAAAAAAASAATEPPRPRSRAELLADRLSRLMEKRLNEPWTLDSIAWACGVSGEHAARVFKAQTGETVFAALTRARMEEAKRLLANSDLPVSQVARRCGIPDQSVFGRKFRAASGETPGAYRRARPAEMYVVAGGAD